MPSRYRNKKYRGGSGGGERARLARGKPADTTPPVPAEPKNEKVMGTVAEGGAPVSQLLTDKNKVPVTIPTQQTEQQASEQEMSPDEIKNYLRQAALKAGYTSGQADRFANTAYLNKDTETYQPGGGIYAGYQYGGRPAEYSDVPMPAGMSEARYNSLVELSQNPERVLRETAAALLPYMSPDGQKAVSDYLAQGSDELAGVYKDYQTPVLSTAEARATLLSKEKAVKAKVALDNMLENLNIEPEDLGEGYKFLVDVLDKLKQEGTEPGVPMTPTQYSEFSGNILDELDAAKENEEKAAFEPLARFLVTPYVGGQNVFRLTKNRKLFS